MCMRTRMETGDALMLAAAQVEAKDYEVPADRLTGELDDLAAEPGIGGPTEDRLARIAEAASETGGEVG